MVSPEEEYSPLKGLKGRGEALEGLFRPFSVFQSGYSKLFVQVRPAGVDGGVLKLAAVAASVER